MKKGLLILFGEWRNFDLLSYQIDNELKDFDVIISTWNYTYGDKNKTDFESKELTKEHILETLPCVKDILIHDIEVQKIQYPINLPWMVYHWKKTLDYIQDDYEIVVLQRFNVLSNLSKLFLNPIDNDTLYYDDGVEKTDGCKWIQDWIIIGSPQTLRSWINILPSYEKILEEIPSNLSIRKQPDPHYILGYYIGLWDKSHLNLSQHFNHFFYTLIKKRMSDDNWLETLKEAGIKFLELDTDSKVYRKVIELLGDTWWHNYERILHEPK